MFAFNGLVKHDLETGTEEVLDAPDGVFVSEAPMAPRDNSTAEDLSLIHISEPTRPY